MAKPPGPLTPRFFRMAWEILKISRFGTKRNKVTQATPEMIEQFHALYLGQKEVTND